MKSINFKNIFITGLFVLIPIIVTVWVIKTLLSVVNNLILPYLEEIGIPTPHIPGLGIIVTLSIIFLLGLLAQNYFGKKFLAYVESLISKIPVAGSVYNATKQTMETLFSKKENFSKVALVRFPHQDTYAIGFIANQLKICDEDYYIVFVPAAINPTSGFAIMVKKQDIIITDLTVEEAMRTIVSGGLVIKKHIKLLKDNQVPAGEVSANGE
ncbi:DUF502 domain-containing protein [Sulfurihydrogenibium azorense]|uniref:Integral membrane protein n=1 Tax=Sulfurihydrogenibium azorense (strain DSM 15241 / OCM 825 / Az-Fu1) TaxID=204536 RepID=C1DXF4_SULAA|nr:DUF502 domain-containing protein [Sulfurihydrogenibium azorense]ACN99149.1 integral membrane protein [Sulfurihydrogenibium azorense Az-Fu1]MDM7273972.1 DUF502 domain-containing protein [Sulfurihydrogenibium azorense]